MVFTSRYRSILLILWLVTITTGDLTVGEDDENKVTNTDVAHEKDTRLLLFATLDGMLTAVEQQTGKVLWKIKNGPVVQVPLITSDRIEPIFLPDPRDGSLYLLDNSTEPLKKLPFTIPQLVSSSPCRSSDGILYTGKKKDTWFKLDPQTGNKQPIAGWGDATAKCSVNPETFIYIGRAKYNIKMIDTKNPNNKWNVTFYDYSARPMSKEDLNSYDLAHFASTANGTLLTFDRRGNLLWSNDLNSPVIRTYLLDSEGLISVPFISMANYTITYLLSQLLTNNGHLQHLNQMRLFPALYIGEHMYGLYATTSLVSQNDITLLTSDGGPLLLGGPEAKETPLIYPLYPLPGRNYRLSKDFTHEDFLNFQSLPKFQGTVIYPGHYNFPLFSDLRESANVLKQITYEDPSKHIFGDKHNMNDRKYSLDIKTRFVPKDYLLFKNETKSFVSTLYLNAHGWINQQENVLKLALISLTGCVIAMFWYLQIQVHGRNFDKNGGKFSSVSTSHDSFSFSEELSNGYVRVGKISFHPQKLLGKGCDGTFVYRGEFDNRQVAVKRLLPDCFTFADREVALLRESDAHPHVIRYYCMEQDRLFRYIALELCQATLFDYVQGEFNIGNIMPLDILYQATKGLEHLHSLDIVHRDIKPHNVLLSMPNNRGEVRAMISDFGLCKKLQVGKISFSRRSGITGTDGWIAPEMLHGNKRTTYAVDLFSLGCLFYYVLSEGSHPFGDSLRRQANILKGDYNLSKIKGLEWQINIQRPLLMALIHCNPEQRPSCKAILQHPMFWNVSKMLCFLQDASDRVEKSLRSDQILQELERNRETVVRQNWMIHVHEELISDLKKYRSYHGDSVRDLLRALRNKKHHFRELSEEAQKILGESTEDFIQYWCDRFPLMLVHTWTTMQCLASEQMFKNYYHETHRYSTDCHEEQRNMQIPNISTQIDRTIYFTHEQSVFSSDKQRFSKDKLYKRHIKRKINKGSKKVDEPIKWVTNG